jgi:hypothetical protein
MLTLLLLTMLAEKSGDGVSAVSLVGEEERWHDFERG